MIRYVILVTDKRFWSSAHFPTTPKPPTAAPCRLRVAEAEHRGSAYPGSCDIWVFLRVNLSVFLKTRH